MNKVYCFSLSDEKIGIVPHTIAHRAYNLYMEAITEKLYLKDFDKYIEILNLSQSDIILLPVFEDSDSTCKIKKDGNSYNMLTNEEIHLGNDHIIIELNLFKLVREQGNYQADIIYMNEHELLDTLNIYKLDVEINKALNSVTNLLFFTCRKIAVKYGMVKEQPIIE